MFKWICERPARTPTRTWRSACTCENVDAKTYLSGRRVLISALSAIRRSGPSDHRGPICVGPGARAAMMDWDPAPSGAARSSSRAQAVRFQLDAAALIAGGGPSPPSPTPTPCTPPSPSPNPLPLLPPSCPVWGVAAHTSSARSHDDALLGLLLGLLRRHKHHTNRLVEDVLEALLRER